jgi:hypothetical protein
MIELTPEDVLRLRALGVKAEPEIQGETDDDIIAALNEQSASYYDALKLAVKSERCAWSEARRWRLWGSLCAIIAAVSLLSQIIVVVARKGGW